MKHFTKTHSVVLLCSLIAINLVYSQPLEETPLVIYSETGITYASSDSPDAATLHIDTKNGRVGVNTINPSQALEVYGKVLIRNAGEAVEIKDDHPYSLWVTEGTVSDDLFLVETEGWADYVFEDNYKLTDLNTLKTFIENHKHLPGIPTQETIAKDGYSQHEINTKYLEKIEELVLYTIEQENRINQLITLVEEQQKFMEDVLKIKAASHDTVNNKL